MVTEIETCCCDALAGDWRNSIVGLGAVPAWDSLRPVPPRTAALAGRAIAAAPHAFVAEAARIFGVKARSELLPWELAWRLFNLCVAGCEGALSRADWHGVTAYGDAAMSLPGGSKLRQAILENVLETTFVAVTLAQSEAMHAPGRAVPAVGEPGHGNTGNPFEATARLLDSAAQADQYPTLCDNVLPTLLKTADRPILSALNTAGPLWVHLTRAAARVRSGHPASAAAVQWLTKLISAD
jgi:hypothetical protein